MTGNSSGSPGNHPHSDRPNWQSAESIDEYLRNCQEGLERFSDRRAAKIMGISRTSLWRWQLMATIPEDLFERLLSQSDHCPSTKELANVARALQGKGVGFDAEISGYDREVLRVRGRWRPSTARVVKDWLETARQDD